MLPKVSRLRKARAFRALQAEGRVTRTPHLTARLRYRADADPSRFAIVVGTRVSPRAVDRHRVARWLKAAVRAELPTVAPGFDVRIGVSAPRSALSYSQCVAEIHALFTKARLRRPA